MIAMNPLLSTHAMLARRGNRVVAAVVAWWYVLFIGAQVLVLTLRPRSYSHRLQRELILREIYHATMPLLLGFLVLSALISLVIIRIVVATALSYGLSQYALDVLVRTLVLELIPLYAALVVAIRYGLPSAQQLRRSLALGQREGQLVAHQALLQTELLPRAWASMFSVQLLAALSCVMALVLAYLSVYGFSDWGMAGYTRSVGQVFTPAVSLIFFVKTLLFSLAVALVPLAAAVQTDMQGRYSRRSDITEFARLFSVVLVIEVLSLVGNYY
jgi:phospholipid/cholesterol/gamma-HCH transport system permease protein